MLKAGNVGGELFAGEKRTFGKVAARCARDPPRTNTHGHDWTAPDCDDIHSAIHQATHEIPT